MMRKLPFVTLAILLLSGLVATAQEQVGSALIDGKKIKIFDDFSWQYASKTPSECQTISKQLEFCGSSTRWRSTTVPSSDVSAVYRYDDRHYAMVIVEELGSADGVSLDFMRQAVLENAAAGAETRVEDVAVFESTDIEVAGFDATNIVYSVPINGLQLVYSNTIISQSNLTLQLITYEVGSQYQDFHRGIHQDFLSEMRIK